jgi:hypothetical protein
MATARGSQVEYLRLMAGLPVLQDPKQFEKPRTEAEQAWQKMWSAHPKPNFTQPPTTVDLAFLESCLRFLDQQESPIWSIKRKALNQFILGWCGWHADARLPRKAYVPGEQDSIRVRFLFRNKALPVQVTRLATPPQATALNPSLNHFQEFKVGYVAQQRSFLPFWLEPHTTYLYAAPHSDLLGQPIGPEPLAISLQVMVGKQVVEVEVPVRYAWVDPATAEHESSILEQANWQASTSLRTVFVPEGQQQRIELVVQAHARLDIKKIQVNHPAGWTIEPSGSWPTQVDSGATATLTYLCKPQPGAAVGALSWIGPDGKPLMERVDIRYDHIPEIAYLQPLEVKLSSAPIAIAKGPVGYVRGAGDAVDLATEALGMKVIALAPADLAQLDPRKIPVVVFGIRAFNIEPQLMAQLPALHDYIRRGGLAVVQYQTVGRSETMDQLAPQTLKIGRSRVSEEDAVVTFLQPESAVLNKPNRLDSNDFQGWVQERGLYFAEPTSGVEAPLGWSDQGEPMRTGGLVIQRHGKGAFIYTGISFFRQLPEGVPGAYRLWANILSHGR